MHSATAQLSGEVDLGGGSSKSEAAPAANIKEITVTGMGETLEAAEKQALAAAIRQAVGAYMDSKTIVENEEIIQDRILSVSNAFVEKYEVVGEPNDFGISLPSYAVSTKILSLSVASETPLFIDATHSYNWEYLITSTTMGTMSLTNADASGGDIISSSFAVSYQVEFNQVGGSGGPLFVNGFDTYAFVGTPDWSNQFPDASTPPGGANFVLGSNGTTIDGATIASASGIFSSNVQSVPEPSSVLLLLAGAAFLCGGARIALMNAIKSHNSKV